MKVTVHGHHPRMENDKHKLTNSWLISGGTKARGPHPIRPLELQVAQSLSLAENLPVNGSWIIQTNPQTVGLGMIRGCLVVEIPWLRASLIADHHPISLKNKRYPKHFKSHPENVCVPNLVTLQVGNWFQCRDPQLLFHLTMSCVHPRA